LRRVITICQVASKSLEEPLSEYTPQRGEVFETGEIGSITMIRRVTGGFYEKHCVKCGWRVEAEKVGKESYGVICFLNEKGSVNIRKRMILRLRRIKE